MWLEPMTPLDASWHLLGLFLPALGTGLLAAAGAKLLWRAELRQLSWLHLALWSSVAGSIVSVAGLATFGRDGRIATYGLMLLACAASLGWAGFWRRR
jgi:hypothetical protein